MLNLTLALVIAIFAPQSTPRRYIEYEDRDPALQAIGTEHWEKTVASWRAMVDYLDGNASPERVVSVLKEVIGLSKKLPGFDGEGSYNLAKFLAEIGRNKEALVAFREAIAWDPKRKCFIETDRARGRTLCDYAILCAKMGKEREAKMLYHSALRQFRGSEPHPFLIVFEKDPNLVEWKYTPYALISAAMLLKSEAHMPRGAAPQGPGDNVDMMRQVIKREPNWILPKIYLACLYGGSFFAEDYPGVDPLKMLIAMKGQLKTKREIEWMNAAISQMDLTPGVQQPDDPWQKTTEIGEALRRKSFLWNEHVKDIEANYKLVADLFVSSRYWNPSQERFFGEPNVLFGTKRE